MKTSYTPILWQRSYLLFGHMSTGKQRSIVLFIFLFVFSSSTLAEIKRFIGGNGVTPETRSNYYGSAAEVCKIQTAAQAEDSGLIYDYVKQSAGDDRSFGCYSHLPTEINPTPVSRSSVRLVTLPQASCPAGQSLIAGSCEDNNDGPPCHSGDTNPINLATGAKYQREVDSVSNGLTVTRTYNGVANSAKWTFNYRQRITVQRLIAQTGSTVFTVVGESGDVIDYQFLPENMVTEVITYHKTDGGVIRYLGDTVLYNGAVALGAGQDTANYEDIDASELPLSTVWTKNNVGSESISIVKNSTTGLISGFEVFKSNGGKEMFDASGRLTSISSPSGNTTNVTYSDNTITVTLNGTSLVYTLNTSGLVTSATWASGETYQYTYADTGLLEYVIFPDQTPDDDLDNSRKQYVYENARYPLLLTGIIDENGNLYAGWEYDNYGRATSSQHYVDGVEVERSEISYTGLSFTTGVGYPRLTNKLGKRTLYHVVDINGKKVIDSVSGYASANCAAANKSYEYYDNGLLLSKTDWQDVKTVFEYNDRSLITSRTEAYGTLQARTIETEWHDTLSLKTKIIEPERTTVYTYDDQGRLTNTTIQSNN